jgi:Mg2+/Co2+ transporter CorB
LEDIPLSLLFGLFVLLILFSAFFSGSETALMALNRYRMQHLAERGHKGARRARALLNKPDRLIGLILLGNNFVNILITQLATYIGYRLYGDAGIAIATGVLTLVLLIFAEVAPKTLGVIHSEKLAYPAAWIYQPLLKITYPLVWLINLFANTVLRILGISEQGSTRQALSSEELRSIIVNESGSLLPGDHQDMLLRILDLEKTTVEDIMIPRMDIIGINLENDWDEIEQQLRQSHFTRIPVYRGSIDNILGFIHARRIISLLSADQLTAETLEQHLRQPYFVPEGTSLTQQLINFRKTKRRLALVVDEYGDILGLVTLEDLLRRSWANLHWIPPVSAKTFTRKKTAAIWSTAAFTCVTSTAAWVGIFIPPALKRSMGLSSSTWNSFLPPVPAY